MKHKIAGLIGLVAVAAIAQNITGTDLTKSEEPVQKKVQHELAIPFTHVVCKNVRNADKSKAMFSTIIVDVDNGHHAIFARVGDYHFTGLTGGSEVTEDNRDPDVYSIHTEGYVGYGVSDKLRNGSMTVFKAKTKQGAKSEGNAVAISLGNGIDLYSSNCTYEAK